MRIVPNVGLSINDQHAPAGVPVECDDVTAIQLIAMGRATKAENESPRSGEKKSHAHAPSPIETAEAPAAPENEVTRGSKRQR